MQLNPKGIRKSSNARKTVKWRAIESKDAARRQAKSLLWFDRVVCALAWALSTSVAEAAKCIYCSSNRCWCSRSLPIRSYI